MIKHTTIRAATVDEAIQKGLAELDLTREDAEIRVISEGKKGFLGFGKQEAIVEVSQKEAVSFKELTHQLEETDRNTSTTTNEHLNSEVSVKQMKNQQESVMTSDKELIEAKENASPEDVEEMPKDKEVQTIEIDVISEEDEEDSNETTENIDEETLEDEVTNTKLTDPYESAQIVADYLVAVIKDYGAQSDIEIDIEGRDVFYDIHTDKSGLVIGKHGKIINSLQILAQTYLSAIHFKHLNVILNVGDYRKRRAQTLESLAEKKVQKAKELRKPVSFEPLPAYERKQIHRYLANHENIKTYSTGREPKRYLVVEYLEED